MISISRSPTRAGTAWHRRRRCSPRKCRRPAGHLRVWLRAARQQRLHEPYLCFRSGIPLIASLKPNTRIRLAVSHVPADQCSGVNPAPGHSDRLPAPTGTARAGTCALTVATRSGVLPAETVASKLDPRSSPALLRGTPIPARPGRQPAPAVTRAATRCPREPRREQQPRALDVTLARRKMQRRESFSRSRRRSAPCSASALTTDG